MINLVLKKKDLSERKSPTGLTVIESKDITVIEKCVELFNEDITWSRMFGTSQALMRISGGHKMFVATFNDKLFGYCWLSFNSDEEFIIYNVFSKKTNYHRNYGATDMLHYVIETQTKGEISAEIDEWNIQSIRMFEKLGFKPY